MRDVFIHELETIAESDPDLNFLTADLGFGVVENFEKKFPKQFYNVGVAEQLMIGVATGLALEGKKVFAYSIGVFPTMRCLEQIRNDAAYHQVCVNIVAVGGGFTYGQLGMSHHATEDIGIMRALPNVRVFCPATLGETAEIVKFAANQPGVKYIRLEKNAVEEPIDAHPLTLGELRQFKEGNEVIFISTGSILGEALNASSMLEQEGISCGVYGCHSLKPIDCNTIASKLRGASIVVTVEEHNVVGGLGSGIAEWCCDNSLHVKNFVRIGMNDQFSTVVGDQVFLREYYELDSHSIYRKVLGLLR
ncbi:MAG: transketolase C-terminal domain-containing protein [Alphaproteobacteria bacterium]